MSWRELAIAWPSSIAGYFLMILVFDAPKWAALLGAWLLIVMFLCFALLNYLRRVVRLVVEELGKAIERPEVE